ncbi:MAG: hypothetical protein H0X50_04685 [Nitrosopumilus sp.]|nr:hypothetical protein [Nitrosopumilus sp.]
MGTHKNELHPCHSFWIFAVTNMHRSKVDKTIREMLIGHSTGLDSAWDSFVFQLSPIQSLL